MLPVTPTARSLLRELDQLPYPARRRLLARIAREAFATPELDDLLRELGEGDHFSRGLALQMAAIAVHREGIVRSLDLSDVVLAAHAIATAVRLGVADDSVAAMVPNLTPELRQVLYRACRRYGATALAGELLPVVRARWGDRDAAALLATCPPETVARLLPELEYAVVSWGSLARRHPREFLDFCDAQLSSKPRASWPELWQRLGRGIGDLVDVEPDRVLALLERSVSRVGIPTSLVPAMAALARHDRQRVLRLLLDPKRPGAAPSGRKFWRAFADESDAHLISLARTVGKKQLARFLHCLPPSRRLAIYQGLLGGRDFVGAGLPVTILDELPNPSRAMEAARILALPSAADDPHIRLQVAARLSWEVARSELTNATRRPAADDRAEAYPLFVMNARASRDPEVVGVMLASLDRLKNEQDPVRAAALSEVASIPASLFREADAHLLRTLMIDAVQARDSSHRTMAAVGKIARALLREGAISNRSALLTVGVDGLELLGQHQARLGLYGLDRDLPRGTERLVLDALRQRIEADAKVGRFGTALALASGLRTRAWGMPELQKMVDDARTAKDDAVVRHAIALWLAPPVTRDKRVEQVLRADRSTITMPAVQSAVSRRRTDLLDVVFRRPLHGRFLKKGVRYIPPFSGDFDAWLPRQTDAYAELLVGLATAPGVPVHGRGAAVRSLGRVPGTIEAVRMFVEDAEIPVQEAALAALAWSDNPSAAIPDLIAHADDDRARVAIYALTRCARFLTAGQLAEYLRPLLGATKITTRKEAIRLLAEHRAADAADLLLLAWSEADQHRDVRRAIAASSRFLLDDERSWDLLSDASVDPDTATATLEIPVSSLAPALRRRYAGIVSTVANSAEPDISRAGLQAMPLWAEWAGQTGLDIASERVTDLRTTATWRQALNALIVSCDVLDDQHALPFVAAALIAHLEDDFEDRDQPARQRLLVLSNRVRSHAATLNSFRRVALRIADLLIPVSASDAIELAASAIPWEEPDSVAETLLALARLADRPSLAQKAQQSVTASLTGVLDRLDPAVTQRFAQDLIDAASPATAMVALGIVRPGGRAALWQEPWRSFVITLRQHEDPDVQAGAIATFMATE